MFGGAPQAEISQGLAPQSARAFRANLERTVPWGGADESFAKYFAEVTLDVVEEQTYKKRVAEEVGPRLVHLRQNALGEATVPPHIEENRQGQMVQQKWTGHPKVDRTMFILDRQLESQQRVTKELGSQKHVPCLRARLERKNYGRKPGPTPFGDSFRSIVLNSSKKSPIPVSHMDTLPDTTLSDEAARPFASKRWLNYAGRARLAA